ncbi:MAG TPA: GntR family transcriptional regulator [Aldersonia sp.]
MPARVTALSIVDALAADLRDRIFRGSLTSEDPLTETEIARTYEVARPTAKAAIEKLVGEGLLQRNAHKTARVPLLGPDDVRDIYRTRQTIEADVLARLAQTRTVPDDARVANAEIANLEGLSTLSIVEPDMRFHTALVDAVGSPRTSRMYRSLVGEVRLCMVQVWGKQLLDRKAIHTEHQGILDAIDAGDPALVVKRIELHLSGVRERLADSFAGLS